MVLEGEQGWGDACLFPGLVGEVEECGVACHRESRNVSISEKGGGALVLPTMTGQEPQVLRPCHREQGQVPISDTGGRR